MGELCCAPDGEKKKSKSGGLEVRGCIHTCALAIGTMLAILHCRRRTLQGPG